MKEGLPSSVALRMESGADTVGANEDLVTGELNDEKEVSMINDLGIEGTMTESENVGCGKNRDIGGECERATGEGNVYEGTDGADWKQLKEELGNAMNIVEKVREKEKVIDRNGEKMAVKDAALNGKAVHCRRLLRRSTMSLRGSEKDDSSMEFEDKVVRRSGSLKEETLCEMELDQDPTRKKGNKNSIEKKGKMGSIASSGSVSDTMKRGKRKRGRSPMAHTLKSKDGAESNKLVGDMRKKLKHMPGRPPKMQGEIVLLKADKEHKDLNFPKRRKISNSNVDAKHSFRDNSCSEESSNAEELTLKNIGYSRKGESDYSETHVIESSSRMRSKNAGTHDLEKKAAIVYIEKKIIRTGKFTEKQLAKERISNLLLEFGWKIDKRPRKGRAYQDSVYVSPEGRRYWSVTLAYSVLKSTMEDGKDNSSSTFIPIPEEVINRLTRITIKGKKRKKPLGKTDKLNQDDVLVGKNLAKKNRNNKRLTHAVKKNSKIVLANKSSTGILKQKLLLHEKYTSKGKLNRGKPKSVSNRSLQETQSRGRCGLLVRNSKIGQDLEDGCPPYPWKRMVLTWMIDSGIVPPDGKVQYFNKRKTRVILEGKITRDGIKCGCCEEVVSIAEFESHSGSKLSRPLQTIFLENGTSLLQCQIDSWNKQNESERNGFHYVDVNGDDPNDDTCGICGDGGDLICCDSCPSTFHQSCLGIQNFPAGDWNCVYCLCKLCGLTSCNANVSDDNHDISGSSIMTCHMCEDRYHQSCIQTEESEIDDPGDSSFCGVKCKELSEKLQMLLGVEHELEDGFSWSLIKRSNIGTNLSHSLMSQKVMSNSKLAVAFLLMDECFVPLSDHRTGVNLIRNVVYNFGSNFNRLNYSGFYTAILERGDEIICAASIRIHGFRLAEMPFIGTRHMYRRQGMCSRLLNAIEKALGSLKIEKFVIPAIAELLPTWTSVFGFKLLEISTRQEMKSMNILAFPGVDMLQKPLLEKSYSENILPTAATKFQSQKAANTIKSNEDVATHTNEISCEMNAKTWSQLPNGSSNASSDITSSDAINCSDSGADPNHLVHLDMTSYTMDVEKKTMVNSEISGCNSHEANGQISVIEIYIDQNVASCSMVTTLDAGKTRPLSETNEDGNCLEISPSDCHERNEQNSIQDINTDQTVVSCSIVNTLGERMTGPHSELHEDGNCVDDESTALQDAIMVDTKSVSKVGKEVYSHDAFRYSQHLEEIYTDQNVASCSMVTAFDAGKRKPLSKPNEDGNYLEISARVFHEKNEQFSIEEINTYQTVVSCSIVNTLDERITGPHSEPHKDNGIDHNIQPSSHVDMIPSTSSGNEEPVDGVNGPFETFTDALDCQKNVYLISAEPDIQTYLLSSLDEANLCNPPELTVENVDGLEVAPTESPNGYCSIDIDTLPGNDYNTDIFLKKPNPESLSRIATTNLNIPSNSFLGDILLDDPEKPAISTNRSNSDSLMDRTRMALSNSDSLCNQRSSSGVDSIPSLSRVGAMHVVHQG